MEQLEALLVHALVLCACLSAVPLAVTSCVALCSSLLQAITQVQEQTLQFGIKLLTVSLIFLVGGSAARRMLMEYCEEVFRTLLILGHV